jgi:TolB-like protein/CheY-like chemotaxis protein/Tfp pilus assembly protein PilF
VQDSPALPADESSPVLLVDDDASNLLVLHQALDGRGYRLLVARNGEDALKVSRRARPLLVLLDVMMPGIDGYETCRRLKEEAPDTAVIFLSALSDVKDKVRGFEAGAVDFITKPFQSDEIVARVQTHVAIQRVLRRSQAGGGPEDDSTRRRLGRFVPAPVLAGSLANLPELDIESSALSSSDPAAPPVFRLGDVVAYRFRVVRFLAKGGMGELYEAEDLELHERVALKTILSTIGQDERSVNMFKREVHLARQVTHPNVCRIYDVYRHKPPSPAGTRARPDIVFLAMELLHGETLADRLEREGRLSTPDALVLTRQMAAALTAAHRVGVVHRDFKTQNVMLVAPAAGGEEVRAVVTDFGLAKRSSENQHSNLSLDLDDAGEISGTPAYMAPEQVEGGPVTPATDQYALGVVLYEMVTGTRPFVAETALKTAIKRLQGAPASPRTHVADLDPRWEAAILRCLAREPSGRFGSVAEGVAALEEPAPAAAAVPHRQRRAGVLAAVAVGVAALAAAYVGRASLFGGGQEGITSLAVLPFANSGKDAEKEYLTDGITESIVRRLSQLPGVRVIANSSTMRYKGRDADPQDVARALGVRGIVTGKVLQRGDDLSVSVELIDMRDQTQVWGEQYSRKASDLLAVQAEISREIADQLRVRLTAGQHEKLAARESVSPQAYELLLRGRFHRSRGSTEDRKKAGEYFRQAIAADPAYSPAYADLADIYRSLVGSSIYDPKEYLPKAEEAARKAIELDPGNADAYFTLANLETNAWEWAAAERDFKRALELEPNLALAHRWYANYLALLGRHDQALTEIQRARELDPLSLGVNATVGYLHYLARRYDTAIEALGKAAAMDRSYPYPQLFLGHTYAAKGMRAEAVAAYTEAIRLGLDTPVTQIRLAAAYAQSGDRDRALAVLERFQSGTSYVSPAELAILQAAAGDRELAFASLEKAVSSHDPQLQSVGAAPAFDPLRSDPRFPGIVRRVGLIP